MSQAHFFFFLSYGDLMKYDWLTLGFALNR